MRKHGCRRPASHGSMFHRRIGSVGMRPTPGRVWKNQAMPGHMGSEKRTVQNLRIVKVIADKNLILVKGAIPGANGDDVGLFAPPSRAGALPTRPPPLLLMPRKAAAKACPPKPWLLRTRRRQEIRSAQT